MIAPDKFKMHIDASLSTNGQGPLDPGSECANYFDSSIPRLTVFGSLGTCYWVVGHGNMRKHEESWRIMEKYGEPDAQVPPERLSGWS